MILNRLRLGLVVCVTAMTTTLACGSDTPTNRSRAPSIAQVQVGASGSGSTTLAPGESRQLFATATNSNGQTTCRASRRGSQNPALATTLSEFGVFVSSGFNGTGARRVPYTVEAHTRSVDVDGFIEIHGLSGPNPSGRHRVTIQKR